MPTFLSVGFSFRLWPCLCLIVCVCLSVALPLYLYLCRSVTPAACLLTCLYLHPPQYLPCHCTAKPTWKYRGTRSSVNTAIPSRVEYTMMEGLMWRRYRLHDDGEANTSRRLGREDAVGLDAMLTDHSCSRCRSNDLSVLPLISKPTSL